MNRDVLIGAGVVLAFIVLVNRAKKNQVTEEPQGGGGGGGGFGPFGPMVPMPPIPPIVAPIGPPATPRPYNQGRSYTAGEASYGPSVKMDVTTEMLKNQQAANTGATATNTGITGIGTGKGTATTTGTGAGSTMTTSQGGNVFTPYKPFSGDAKFMGFVGSTPKFEFN
jgi:hypothetical protein